VVFREFLKKEGIPWLLLKVACHPRESRSVGKSVPFCRNRKKKNELEDGDEYLQVEAMSPNIPLLLHTGSHEALPKWMCT
jgi:hypothetical protein